MEINKEREDFEKEAFKQSGGWATFHKAYGDVYENNQLNFAWKVWQAAKQQAVPEGFVLVPRKATKHQINKAIYDLNLSGGTDILVDIYKAMVEAQEQSHDNSN